MRTIKAAFVSNFPDALSRVYGAGRRERIEELTSCHPGTITSENFDGHAGKLKDLEVIFSTWGMPLLTASQLDLLPRLKAVFYAAGSIRSFYRPLFDRGVTVVSAWAANAVPVAEFTLAQILLANKGYFQNVREYRGPECWKKRFAGPGNFDETVALLGAGQIGRRVIELLKPYNLRVAVFDPFLSDANAEKLGVSKVNLDQAFRESTVVSNHLANLPATVGMLNRNCFEVMRPNAVFINTGRGATVVENDLVAVLEKRRDLVALLDVTEPEPPVADSPLYSLPNAFLTPHIAGSAGNEVVRMADYMTEEFLAWQNGGPLQYAVTPAMIETMA
jgi:phosphoglycerate dehydrogenase-like enzyme